MVSSSTISFTDPPAFPPQTRPADTRTTFEKVGKWMFEDKDSSSSHVTAEACCCPCVAYGRTRMRLSEAVNRRNGIYETREKH